MIRTALSVVAVRQYALFSPPLSNDIFYNLIKRYGPLTKACERGLLNQDRGVSYADEMLKEN